MPSNVAARLVLALLWGTFVVGARGRALAESGADGALIVAIEFECVAPIDRDGLLGIMPVRVGDTLAADTLDGVRERLAQTELFTQMAVEAQPRGSGVAVVAHLVRKVIVNSVRFRGNHTLGDDELLRVARVREGTALTDDLREYAVARLRERYATEGFEVATVTLDVRTRSPGEVDVIFHLDEGPPLRIDRIDIDGLLPLPQADVRDVIGLKAGGRYTRAQQRRAQTAIVRLFREKQYYEVEVDDTWEHGADHSGVLRFAITPGPLFAVRFSGNRYLGDAKLLGLMDLPKRPIVTDGTWRELARRAQRAYQEAGYYFARVVSHIEPGPPKAVHFEVHEGVRDHIAAVRFEGVHGVAAHELLNQMATLPASWVPWRRGVFLDDVLDDDLKRLWYFYRRQGFESAEIVDVHVRHDPDRGEVFVTVFIEEGPRTVVRSILTDGTDVITGAMPGLHVVVGEPLDPEAVEAGRRALLTAFAQSGYTHAVVRATVTTQPEADRVAAAVRFEAQPGEQQHVGTIIVQDNLDTRTRVIARELPFKPGAVLNPDALLQGQSNIYRLGLFRSVTVRPLEATANAPISDVGVNVSEKPAGTILWGAGYNTRDGIRGFVEVAHNNLQGLARRLSLRGEFNFDPTAANPNQYVGNLGFREPRIDETQWTFRANLIAQRSTRAVDQFSFERYAFIPAIERTLLPGLQVGSEVQVEQSQVFDVKPDVLAEFPKDEGWLRTISLGPFAIYDRRDDAFVPHRGTFDSLRVKFAPSSLGSDVPFIKLVAQHSHYIPLDDDVTFVYAVRAGWARAYEGNDQLPIRERFFLGGRTTVRGFGENVIGPQGSQGHPLGGDLVVNLNTEVRFPLVFGFGGVVFVDGGGVYLQDRALSLRDFRRSSGLGLRYITPIGAISLEYGFKLDRRADESVGEVHFSIGNIF
jgi:outer membrane protein insertion porin family